MSINNVHLEGNLGRDAEERITQQGKRRCKLSVATSFGEGEKERTTWHNVVCRKEEDVDWCLANLKKGARVKVLGWNDNYSFDGKDGKKVYFHEVVVRTIEAVEGTARKAKEEIENGAVKPGAGPDDEDIPF